MSGARGKVSLEVPFESLEASLAGLDLKDKLRLWQLLEEQIAQSEEDTWERDPAFEAAIREARAAYDAGDYLTFDDYVAQRRRKAG